MNNSSIEYHNPNNSKQEYEYYRRDTGEIVSLEDIRSGKYKDVKIGMRLKSKSKEMDSQDRSPANDDPFVKAAQKHHKEYNEAMRTDAPNMANSQRPVVSQPSPQPVKNEHIENTYKDAAAKSCPAQKQTTKRNRMRAFVSKTAVALALAGLVTVGAHSIGTGMINNINDMINFPKASDYVSQEAYGSLNAKDIAISNTKRTNDNTAWRYDHSGLAWDICNKIADTNFDAALYIAYKEMKSYPGDIKSNFDEVIKECNYIASLSPTEHPFAYARTNECYNFADFAKRNGFIDKNGNPSYEEYVEFGKKAIATYLTKIQMAENAKAKAEAQKELTETTRIIAPVDPDAIKDENNSFGGLKQ